MATKKKQPTLYFADNQKTYGKFFWLLIVFVSLISLLIVAALYFKQNDEYEANKAVYDKLLTQYNELVEERDQLQRRELNADSKDYIEQLARSELNMVKPGDKVYVEKED